MTAQFVTTRRVEFADTDMAGIIHFANYYRYMEEAEHTFIRSLGLSVGDRACLALGIALGHRVLTADHAWSRLDLPVAVVQIR